MTRALTFAALFTGTWFLAVGLAQFFAGGTSQGDVAGETMCRNLVGFEHVCQLGWVRWYLPPESGVDRADLLRLCGEDHACRLEVLLARPGKDEREQTRLCAAYVPLEHPACMAGFR